MAAPPYDVLNTREARARARDAVHIEDTLAWAERTGDRDLAETLSELGDHELAPAAVVPRRRFDAGSNASWFTTCRRRATSSPNIAAISSGVFARCVPLPRRIVTWSSGTATPPITITLSGPKFSPVMRISSPDSNFIERSTALTPMVALETKARSSASALRNCASAARASGDSSIDLRVRAKTPPPSEISERS